MSGRTAGARRPGNDLLTQSLVKISYATGLGVTASDPVVRAHAPLISDYRQVMEADGAGGAHQFARYKRASNALSGLRAELAALNVCPDGRVRQTAMNLNADATADAQVELEAAFLAYLQAV